MFFLYCLGFGARGSAHTPWARPSWAGPGCIQPVPGGMCGVSTAASGQARSGCVLSRSYIWVPRDQRRRVHPQPRCRFRGTTKKKRQRCPTRSVLDTATLRSVVCGQVPSSPVPEVQPQPLASGVGEGAAVWCYTVWLGHDRCCHVRAVSAGSLDSRSTCHMCQLWLLLGF